MRTSLLPHDDRCSPTRRFAMPPPPLPPPTLPPPPLPPLPPPSASSPPRRPRSDLLVAAGVLSAAAQMRVPPAEVLYREPADAAVPTRAPPWGFYCVPPPTAGAPAADAPYVRLERQRFYLLGRDAAVAHVLLSHPSVSKQHAVLQFRESRWHPGAREVFGSGRGGRSVRTDLEEEGPVVPWLIDLGSRNGTYLNGARIPAETFVRIQVGDTAVFGASADEYVFIQEPPSPRTSQGDDDRLWDDCAAD